MQGQTTQATEIKLDLTKHTLIDGPQEILDSVLKGLLPYVRENKQKCIGVICSREMWGLIVSALKGMLKGDEFISSGENYVHAKLCHFDYFDMDTVTLRGHNWNAILAIKPIEADTILNVICPFFVMPTITPLILLDITKDPEITQTTHTSEEFLERLAKIMKESQDRYWECIVKCLYVT